MAFKKTKEESSSVEATITLEVPQKDVLFHLLKKRIPGLFDREPQGSISHQGLEKLVDDILNI